MPPQTIGNSMASETRYTNGISKKRKRTSLSCTQCRKRKLKCNRMHPCSSCSRRKVTCNFEDPSSIIRVDTRELEIQLMALKAENDDLKNQGSVLDEPQCHDTHEHEDCEVEDENDVEYHTARASLDADTVPSATRYT
ncbi:Multidrug resistance regulator 1 [Neolecta irregularis DAH-3]|uniref:Multidrug resistance regulator 1 n=1 Tax=Neolecta irregularis (strain DAH-3) TaxID=1198029 RepID=A0A1U7LMF5_NEOID|nr:Multidrug resistance regulator 1 [Neolecta irregularis DAH-3]|eukprot:OLL23850.1 Multidrug resistance regulator 1 [Neolecta irregularis DAH-3]